MIQSKTQIYKCEYVESNNKIFRKVTKEQIKNMNELTSKHSAPSFNTSWTQNFIDYYGVKKFEQFLDFIVKYGINDLHSQNIGYIKGRPVVLDYAGYFEPSNDSCNY